MLYPFLTYSHIREAVAGLDDFEERITALMAVSDGDPRYPAFSVSLPMTVDQFKAYLQALSDVLGKPAPAMVLWRGRGTGLTVWADLQREHTKWTTRHIEIIVREVKR